MVKKVPLLAYHENHAAELGEFAGWKTVITYSSLREEHQAVRSKAGIFDISHMTRTKIAGAEAVNLLQNLLTIDVEKLKPGKMKYGLILNENAGIIDDVTLYKVSASSFIMVSNAVTREKVLSWIRRNASSNVYVEDFTESSAFYAVQGPEAVEHVSRLWNDVLGFKWFEGGFRQKDGCDLLVTRSGYTGGDGFEILVPCGGYELFEKIWRFFVEGGVYPCGLACRDLCRIEAGFPLYGQDFDESVTPVEAGLTWAVKTDKPFFIGKQALLEKMASPPAKVLSLLEMKEPGIPRPGYKIYVEGEEVGVVTSGAFVPSSGQGLALGYLKSQFHSDRQEVYIDVRGKLRKAVVRTEPPVRLKRT